MISLKKFTDWVIEKRMYILVVFIIFTIVCAYLSMHVHINYDISKYLPKTSETRVGMDIMEERFDDTSSSLYIMFDDLKENEKEEVTEYLEQISGVSEVNYEEKDSYSLYEVVIEEESDSKVAHDLYQEVSNHFKDKNITLSGSIKDRNMEILPIWVVGLAIFFAFLILIFMCESFFEPVLFLVTILMAVVLNRGTNIFFPSVSHITNSIVAILQLALSMDYSIMLMNRYNQEREVEKDKVKAMKSALHHSFQSISSSSVTTIAGLLALVFMSFTIGKDLGLVLAKGVLFSLLCIFFVLPTLILLFEKWIIKTKKKSPTFKMKWLSHFSYHIRKVVVPIFLLILVGSFLLKGNLGYHYTNSNWDETSKIFEKQNQIAIIYDSKEEENILPLIKELEQNDKIKEILGYGNTIHEPLNRENLKQRIKDLGSEVNISDDTLKLLFYYYVNQEENNQMTLKQMVDFIKENVYTSEEFQDTISSEMKENIAKLENFISEESIYKKRSIDEIANLLDIDSSNVKDFFILYQSKHTNTKMTLKEFINFLNEKVLNDKVYSKMIDENTKQQIAIMTKLINQNQYEQKLNAKDMALLLGIDESISQELYVYFVSSNEMKETYTLQEFFRFVVQEILPNKTYQSYFTEEEKQNILLLEKFTNSTFLNEHNNASGIAKLFQIKEEDVEKLLLFKYLNEDTTESKKLSDVILIGLSLKEDKLLQPYLQNGSLDSLEPLKVFASNENHFDTTKVNKNTLSTIFGPEIVNALYQHIPEDTLLSPQEFVNEALKSLPNENLKMIRLVIDSATNELAPTYTPDELSKITKIDKKQLVNLYHLIDYKTKNTSSWYFTPNEFVTLLLNEPSLIDENTLDKLKLIDIVRKNKDKNYTYQELSSLLNEDDTLIKNMYSLKYMQTNEVTMTPEEFVTFVLTHQNDEALKSLSNASLQELNSLNKIITSLKNNIKYNKNELAQFLNNNQMSLLYGLFDVTKNGKNTMSYFDFVEFLLNEVVTDANYSKNFDSLKVQKLKTLSTIMKNLNQTYHKEEVVDLFQPFTNLDKDLISVLYLYYGSKNDVKESLMTVEEFVNFCNDVILKEERFDDFIEEEMKENIQDAKEKIEDAKSLLITDDYSRVVLNTTYPLESEETFDFIKNLKDKLHNKLNESYVIGDSLVAYEMNNTFESELNKITIITMIVIFVVVAFTFRSVLIPIILTFMIQCAVFITMGILSFHEHEVYFIAILIVQSILMGATIDYAILYTSYYLEQRKEKDKKESIILSYQKSIVTILTSASILTLVTLIVGHFTSEIVSIICKTISEGTLCSSILILLFLPALLLACDKWIVKKNK